MGATIGREKAYSCCLNGGQVLLWGSSCGKRILQEAFGWARCLLVSDQLRRGWSTMFDEPMAVLWQIAELFLDPWSENLIPNISYRFEYY